jgi:hypothetical protein
VLTASYSYATRDHSTQETGATETRAKARALLSAPLFPRYLTLALGALQVAYTPFTFIHIPFVQLESREYGLRQIVLYSWLNLA